ncbi:hypothetical protein [Aquibacillus saliphilus]|uniref:hypothetical protein n=1 Tax=Aquibacillus saliphilus TaxID=1909422 RepID=UPI001CF0B6BA|nr:hypothetical protein [Aquibacillus saliphilus]
MSKTKELIEIINTYPEHKLIFMYPEEGSEHPYTMGYPTEIIVDEYWIDDERVWLKYDNEGEMSDHYGELIFDDLYPDVKIINDEQDKVVDKKTQEFIDSQDWQKCICVYIHY